MNEKGGVMGVIGINEIISITFGYKRNSWRSAYKKKLNANHDQHDRVHLYHRVMPLRLQYLPYRIRKHSSAY